MSDLSIEDRKGVRVAVCSCGTTLDIAPARETKVVYECPTCGTSHGVHWTKPEPTTPNHDEE